MIKCFLLSPPNPEAGSRMQLELEKLKGDIGKKPSEAASSTETFKKTAAKSSPKPPKPSIEPGPPETEAAKMARLRRICERKPSGKVYCNMSLHEQWKNGTKEDREALVDILESCNWSKDLLYVKQFPFMQ